MHTKKPLGSVPVKGTKAEEFVWQGLAEMHPTHGGEEWLGGSRILQAQCQLGPAPSHGPRDTSLAWAVCHWHCGLMAVLIAEPQRPPRVGPGLFCLLPSSP